jgi:hypothetical protein
MFTLLVDTIPLEDLGLFGLCGGDVTCLSHGGFGWMSEKIP